MRSLSKSVANYRTSTAGLILAALVWWQNTGFALPSTKQETAIMLGGMAIVVLGLLAKDGATGSAPGKEE